MTDTLPRTKSDTCPVCEGAGYWDAITHAVIWTKPPPAGSHRCPFCEGTGKTPERQPAF